MTEINNSHPALEATMYFSYGQYRRIGVTALTTFDAILRGERTSTTRFDIWPGTERWGKLKAGMMVRFFEDKDKRGSYVDVIVDSVRRVDLAIFSPADLENWSQAEGWSAEHGAEIGKRGPGYQIRFHIPGPTIADSAIRGAIHRTKIIRRCDLQANPETLYIFGDNMQRTGRGGQAAEMRGEPNALGVPTKWKPARTQDAYFTDGAWSIPEVKSTIENAFKAMEAHLASGRDIVLPADGIGTGLAELPTRAPKLFARLQKWFAVLEERGKESNPG